MKGIVLATIVIGGMSCVAVQPAKAAQIDDVVARLENENAAIRRENAALRAKSTARETRIDREVAMLDLTTAYAAKPSSKRSGPLEAYAADLPSAYKVPAPVEPGRLRLWGEGGAIWSGGTPVNRDFSLTNFNINTLFGFGPGGNNLIPGTFDLTPKLGWEGAAGFDYRFAASPWHVSGQLRYGEGQASNSAATAGSFTGPPIGLVVGGGAFVFTPTIGGDETFAASNKETHWLADLAVGRDVLGSGADALQLKLGLRIAEFKSNLSTTDLSHVVGDLQSPLIGFAFTGVPITSFSSTNLFTTAQQASFLGAGPRLGVDGSVPFLGNWSLDYLGDAAVLIGTQRLDLRTTSITSAITVPAIYATFFSSGTGFRSTIEKTAAVFNGDIQLALSYWFTPNLKVSGSYRLDAYFNVVNTSFSTTKQTIDRYTHGPRVGVTAQF